MSEIQYAVKTVAARFEVDPTPDGRRVLLIYTDDDLDSLVIRMSPAAAAKLGHKLINVAAQQESPT